MDKGKKEKEKEEGGLIYQQLRKFITVIVSSYFYSILTSTFIG